MGRANQETWKQPPVSLIVEWPTDCAKQAGPNFEEQKARMRETRAVVINAIAASGYPVPYWPEVGRPVNWCVSQHLSAGEGVVNVNGQANRPASHTSRVPLRYQASNAITTPRTPQEQVPRGIASSSFQNPSTSSLPTRPRSKSHQSGNTSLVKAMMDAARTPDQCLNTQPLVPSWFLQAHNDLPVGIDSSIFNPRVFVGELPDHIFQRTPPTAPRAMLEQISKIQRQNKRTRKDSDATVSTSQQSYETARSRGRGCSTTTLGSHHSCESQPADSSDFAEPRESSKTALAHISPPNPPIVEHGYSSTGVDTTTIYQDVDGPASEFKNNYQLAQSIPPPPEPYDLDEYHDSESAPFPPPSLDFENSVVDFIDTTGTWTYSKIWVSEEERLRIKFMRIQENAHHASLDKSPFFPQNVSEYAALLAEKKTTEAERIRKKIPNDGETVRTQLRSIDYLPWLDDKLTVSLRGHHLYSSPGSSGAGR